MKKSFYYIDADYIQYLKEVEIIARGFTTVPNVEYVKHNKFVYGAARKIGVMLTTHNATMLNALNKNDLIGVNVVYRAEASDEGKIIPEND